MVDMNRLLQMSAISQYIPGNSSERLMLLFQRQDCIVIYTCTSSPLCQLDLQDGTFISSRKKGHFIIFYSGETGEMLLMQNNQQVVLTQVGLSWIPIVQSQFLLWKPLSNQREVTQILPHVLPLCSNYNALLISLFEGRILHFITNGHNTQTKYMSIIYCSLRHSQFDGHSFRWTQTLLLLVSIKHCNTISNNWGVVNLKGILVTIPQRYLQLDIHWSKSRVYFPYMTLVVWQKQRLIMSITKL